MRSYRNSANWRDPPQWFANKDYTYLNRLDARGWLKHLEKCHSHASGFNSADGSVPDTYYPVMIGPPVLQIVESASQRELTALEKPALIVQVWLRAPDKEILEEFAKALRSARTTYPAPARKRGPITLNGTFDKSIFLIWLNRKIIQYADLACWRSKQPGRGPRDADIARWLFARGSNSPASPEKELSTTKKTLKQALESIPALWAQVNGVNTENTPTNDGNAPCQ